MGTRNRGPVAVVHPYHEAAHRSHSAVTNIPILTRMKTKCPEAQQRYPEESESFCAVKIQGMESKWASVAWTKARPRKKVSLRKPVKACTVKTDKPRGHARAVRVRVRDRLISYPRDHNGSLWPLRDRVAKAQRVVGEAESGQECQFLTEIIWFMSSYMHQ